jgi:hypothetical protein
MMPSDAASSGYLIRSTFRGTILPREFWSPGGPVSEKAPLKVRARLRVRVPAVPTQAAGIGALWVGLAGSSVSNKVSKVKYLVCPAHRRRPRLEHLDVIAGRWTVDTQVCCRAFLTMLRERLASTKPR